MKLIKLWEADPKLAYELYGQFEEDENGFLNEAYGYSYSQFLDYIEMRKENALGNKLPYGYVPSSEYILEDEGKYVAIFKLRHYLNISLKFGAGHIGFGVSKNDRQKGYGKKGLSLLVEEAKKVIPEREIHLCCFKENKASLNTQLSCGAYIHHENGDKIYTRIKIKEEPND